jgi:hypothetical protein
MRLGPFVYYSQTAKIELARPIRQGIKRVLIDHANFFATLSLFFFLAFPSYPAILPEPPVVPTPYVSERNRRRAAINLWRKLARRPSI